MNVAAVLAPVFVQIALTFGLLIWMGTLRVQAVRDGTLHVRDIALGQPSWPERITQVQNAYQNQFELPVLFYVLVALALISGRATATFIVLSWLFVVLRLFHALIHTTTNNVPRRFFVYTAGMAVLILMWLWFLFSVVFA